MTGVHTHCDTVKYWQQRRLGHIGDETDIMVLHRLMVKGPRHHHPYYEERHCQRMLPCTESAGERQGVC